MRDWGYVGGDSESFDFCHAENLTLATMDKWMAGLNQRYYVRYWYKLVGDQWNKKEPLDEDYQVSDTVVALFLCFWINDLLVRPIKIH